MPQKTYVRSISTAAALILVLWFVCFLVASGATPLDDEGDDRPGGLGVGLGIASATQAICISSILDGGAADVAGLRIYDVIIAVDGESTFGMSIEEVLALIRGPAGEVVRITAVRHRDVSVAEFSIPRMVIKPQPIAASRPNLRANVDANLRAAAEKGDAHAQLLYAISIAKNTPKISDREDFPGLTAVYLEIARWLSKAAANGGEDGVKAAAFLADLSNSMSSDRRDYNLASQRHNSTSQTCPVCNGLGQEYVETATGTGFRNCYRCDGTGQIR